MYQEMTCARAQSLAREFITRFLSGTPNASQGIDFDGVLNHCISCWTNDQCNAYMPLLGATREMSPAACRKDPQFQQWLRVVKLGHLL